MFCLFNNPISFAAAPAQWLTSLLLLCGDVEANPGPRMTKKQQNIQRLRQLKSDQQLNAAEPANPPALAIQSGGAEGSTTHGPLPANNAASLPGILPVNETSVPGCSLSSLNFVSQSSDISVNTTKSDKRKLRNATYYAKHAKDLKVKSKRRSKLWLCLH